MKYCEKCNKEFTEDILVCDSCGSPLVTKECDGTPDVSIAETNDQAVPQPDTNKQSEQLEQPEQPVTDNSEVASVAKKSVSKGLIAGIIALAAIVIGVIIYFCFPRIVEIEASYNGDTEEGVVLNSSNSGFVVIGKTKNGTEKTIKSWQIESPETLEKDLSSTVVITYKDMECKVIVDCSTSAVKSLEVTYEGDTEAGTVLDSNNNGFKVTAFHKNGTKTKNVTGWTIKKSETLEADGTSTVTIVYDGIEKSCSVECTTRTLESIEASYSGNTEEGTIIGAGDKDITVTAVYKNGSKENVTGWTIDENVTLQAGAKASITIKYEDKECVLEVQCSTMSPDQYKAQCNPFSYETVARNPDEYEGKLAKFKGEVLQCLEDDSYNEIRLAIKQESWGWSSDEVIYVVYENTSGSRILEGDVITVYGEMAGLYSYEAVSGATITLPIMYAMYVD